MNSPLTSSNRSWLQRLGVLCLVGTALLGSQLVGAESTESESANVISEPQASVFFPITPCRLMDTRQPIGDGTNRVEPIGPGEIVTQDVVGKVGKVGDCLIPLGANALSLNVTALRGTETSFLTVFPANAAEVPLASNLNWTAGASPTPNKVDVQLSYTGFVGSMALFNSLGEVDVIVDVAGYYSPAAFSDATARTIQLEQAHPSAESAARTAAIVDSRTTDPSPVLSHTFEPVLGHAIISYNLTHLGVNTSAGMLMECTVSMPSGSGPVMQQRRITVSDTVGHLGDSFTVRLNEGPPSTITLECGPVDAEATTSILVSGIDMTILTIPEAGPNLES